MNAKRREKIHLIDVNVIESLKRQKERERERGTRLTGKMKQPKLENPGMNKKIEIKEKILPNEQASVHALNTCGLPLNFDLPPISLSFRRNDS